MANTLQGDTSYIPGMREAKFSANLGSVFSGEIKLVFASHPVVVSTEPGNVGGVKWSAGGNASGLELKDIPNVATPVIVANLNTITLFSPAVSYEKIIPLALRALNYSFELPNEMSLQGDKRSINERLGNINPGDPFRDGAKNAAQDKGNSGARP